MSKFGTRTIHVFGTVDLSDFEDDIAATAQNDRWTSFTPKKPTTFDSLPVSKLFGIPVFDMWFNDATGIVARLHQHGLIVGVFTLPEKHPNAYDAGGLAAAFEVQDVLTKAQMKTLKKHAADTKTFGKWTREHGLEKLLGLPDVPALPAKKKTAPTSKKKAAATSKKKAAATSKKKKAAAPEKKAAKWEKKGRAKRT